MVALKSADVDKFLARPDPGRPVVLIFGEDAGLVSERAHALLEASVDDINDPFSLVRLEGEQLAAEPTRLIDEAQTMPLFGGRRAVWVKAGGRNIAPAVEALLALPQIECRVVIEAADLRRNSPLRAICERARNAAALPCYADTGRDLERLIDAEVRAAGVSIAPDARALLVPLLGADRGTSRGELHKLLLYAHGRREITTDDIIAVVSDASGLEIEEIVDAAFAGRPAELETHLAKARVAGTSIGSVFFAAQRQLAQLHKWRTAIEAAGGPVSVDTLVPPVHFRRKSIVEAALKAWTTARLSAAMAELASAVLASRRSAALADSIAERALLQLAVSARRSAA